MLKRFLLYWSVMGLLVFCCVDAYGDLKQNVYRKYSLQYSDENTTTIFPSRLGKKDTNPQTFMSTFSFDGDLTVAEYGTIDGKTVQGFSFDRIRQNSFAMNGHDFFNDPDQFIEAYKKKEVFVELNQHKEIQAFYYPDETPQVYKQFMTTIAQEIQVSLHKGKNEWTGVETNQHGSGVVDYQVTGKTNDTVHLLKTRKRYVNPGLIDPDDVQDIKLNNKITLDGEGHPDQIDKLEMTKISSKQSADTILDVKKTLKMKRIDTGTFQPGLINAEVLHRMEKIRPGDAIPDKGIDKKLLVKRAGYLSYHEIENWISQFKPNEKNNRANNSMFYRTTGFVKLQPKSAEMLARYCNEKATSSQQRILVMNILAGTGTPAAQKAMRAILSDKTIRRDTRQSGVMIQNFSFMDEKPEPETIAFLKNLMTTHKGYISYSAAHAFGSGIHKLYKNDDKETAIKLNEELLRMMNEATKVKDKKEYIAALGNAGLTENNTQLFTLFSSPHSEIRSETAMAIRKTETPEARKKLLNLFPDSERSVQRSAVQTYFHFMPDKRNMEKIRHYLDTGQIEEANYYDMVSLLKKNRSSFPLITNVCFKIMVRKKLKDPDLEARIRGLIKK